MINILFIAFEFPPLNNGGVYRSLAFVKYLPKFGINPIVITLHKDSYNDTFEAFGFDENLGKEVIEQSTMIPVKSGVKKSLSKLQQFTSIYFSIHGNEVNNWKKKFYAAVHKAIEQYAPEMIFATVPPFSILPLTNTIAKKYKLPLVLDFRDAWSQWRTLPYGTVFHYWKTLKMERKYLNSANAIIGTSKQTLDEFKKLHSKIPASKFHYIPNGYNGELLNWKPINPHKELFTIGYVGSFYFSAEARKQMLDPWWKKRGHKMLQYIPHIQDWLYRSPYFFFKTIKQFNISYPVLAKKIRIKFAGKKPNWLIEMIRQFGLEEQVDLMGELSHHESLLFQQQCAALLITSAKQLGGRDYSIAGKTFEYLQMQKPIIAFVCEGAQKDLLEEAGTAMICDPDNTEEAVVQLHDLFTGRIQLSPRYNFLNNLTRERLTAQLAEIIKRIIKHS